VYYPLDCHLSPSRFVAELTRAMEREGVALRYETPVTGWRVENGRVRAARTPEGEITADEYVLAGGAWTPGLARDLRLRLPMLAGKGYSFTLARPPEIPEICSILVEARVAVTPMDGTLRFAGTMELAGLDLSVNAARVRGIRKAIPRYFPAFRAEDLEAAPVWSGLRPCSPDGLPYLGRPAACANLVIAAGHAMMGVSLAPITGRLVADIVSGEPPALDIALLHPDRYR
jgi:D-amino-acid dehydrogenase